MIELLLACAPAVDPVMMSSIVKQESGGHPWSINDNNGKRSYRLKSKDEAVLKATELISAGHSIDMGLAQINSKNLRWLGLSVTQAFDPCTNVAAGATVLTQGYQKTGSLQAALSIYNTGKPDSPRGQQYARQVLRHAGVIVPAPAGGKVASLPPLKGVARPTPSESAAAEAEAPSASQEPISVAISPAASGFSPSWR